ncbi:hypothetical protein [Cardiobacterium valvarum]|uniref:Uncharacterized protein n=1 Tax=Cardiobacterium valvarum F0432 TaxID=797473 RepID=G9ZED8_9GAMM|nr:hypothetical protein [Cardiobacterium valvarum]EHM54679.1 hypothetical protein HMPREF9080_01123 [Cardiobacterium valvarum F0432]
MAEIKNYLTLTGNYAEQILSYYLWGQMKPPAPTEIADPKFIRSGSDQDEKASLTVYVNADDYMLRIGHNLPLAQQRMFQYFFNNKKAAGEKTQGWDAEITLQDILNVGGFSNEQGEIKLTHEQFLELTYKSEEVKHKRYDDAANAEFIANQYYIDTNSDDYWMRGFAFGSTKLKLDTNKIRYVFNAKTGKALRLENVYVKPQEDNFDFISNDGLAGQVNPILRQIMDPSGIGRKVEIRFDYTDDGYVKLNKGIYTQEDYRSYIQKVSVPTLILKEHGDRDNPDDWDSIYPDKPSVEKVNYNKYFQGLKSLYQSSVFDFRNEENKVVFFGTDRDDEIESYKAKNLILNKNINLSSIEGALKRWWADFYYDLEKLKTHK